MSASPHCPPPKDSRDSKSTKLAQRLSYILVLLHQGDVIDKHALAQTYGVTLRTIERDLCERLADVVERNTQGQWQLRHQARSTIPTKLLHGYARLVGAQHLFPDTRLSYLLEQLETPEPRRSTQVQPIAQEDLREHGSIFTQLQKAIQTLCECRFTYKAKLRHAQPYRLIHKNGIWYLAAQEAGILKNFSIGLIENLQIDESSHFIPKSEHLDYINAKEDVWFGQETTEVLLRVAPPVAHYFQRRALLPRQQQRPDSDGSLLVTARIDHRNQLFPVVRSWLPHVRILQPLAWHQELVQDLRQALVLWDED